MNHPKNQWLFTESWGVDRCVSGAHLLVAMVEEAVVAGTMVELLQLEGGHATLAEVTLAPSSRGVGCTITEVALPPGAAVVALIRDGTVIVPRPDSLLVAGDEVMVLVGAGAGDAVVAALVGDRSIQSSS